MWRDHYVAYVHQYKYTYSLSEKNRFENLVWKKQKQPHRGVLENRTSETCKFSHNKYEEVQIYRLITCNFTKNCFLRRYFSGILDCKFHVINFRKAIFKSTFFRILAVAHSETIRLTRESSIIFFLFVFLQR